MGESERINGKLLRLVHTKLRRCCAAILCASLIVGNLPYMAAAGSETTYADVKFSLDMQQLSDALSNALECDEPFVESLDFRGAEAERYEEAMSNTLYELTSYLWETEQATLSNGKQKQDLELRIFASMGSELVDDSSYDLEHAENPWYEFAESDGFQGLYFLLVNHKDKEQTAVIQIDEKETEIIHIAPYAEVELDEVEQELTAAVSHHRVDSVAASLATSANAEIFEHSSQENKTDTETSNSQIKESDTEHSSNQSNIQEFSKNQSNTQESSKNQSNIQESDKNQPNTEQFPKNESDIKNETTNRPIASASNAEEAHATESNATESNATESNTAKDSLEGELFEAVRLGSDSAVLFAVTWEDAGFDFFGASTLEAKASAAVNEVPADKASGVTVKMFNYDISANKTGLGTQGYEFFHDINTYGKAKDGTAQTTKAGTYNFPDMKPLLANGYPNTEKGSMEYLFQPSGTYYKGTAKDGGGLFQKDENGYYYYDSMENAAYFDETKQWFTLYDCVVRPNYTGQNESDVAKSNFLPFNAIVGNVIADEGEPSKVQTGVRTTKLSTVVDLWFGMTVEFDFMMPKDGRINGNDMIFDFHGDDDVFVYIDDVLVLDIGGTHAAQSASINFASGKAEDPRGNAGGKTLKQIYEKAKVSTQQFQGGTFADYTMHKLKFFYMERGGNISYCKLKFNMPILPEKSLTVEKEVTAAGDGSSDFFGDTLEYQFQVMQANASGASLNKSFFSAGTEFTIQEGNTDVGTGTIGSDGIFSLKAGQKALFTNMLGKAEEQNCYHYVVQEVIPQNLTEQYDSVEYQVSTEGGATASGGKNKSELQADSVVSTGALSAESTQYVLYRNKVDTLKLSYLKIRKEKTAGTVFEEGQKFEIQVKLGGQLIPKGTAYTVGTETRTVETAGILQLGISETAELCSGIVAGVTYEVCEVIPDGADYKASYTGQTSGTFAPESIVFITVINSDYDMSVEIPIQKTTVGFADSQARTFDFTVEPCDEKGNVPTVHKAYEGASIEISGDGTKTGIITIGYKENSSSSEIYYYKISESEYDIETILCDQRQYVAKVKVADGRALLEAVYVLERDGSLTKISGTTLAFTNVNSTEAVVHKTVDGNMADQSKQFSFKAVLTDSSEDGVLGSAIYAFDGSNECAFTLKHGEAYQLKKLPVGAVLTVTETVGDYTVTYQIDSGTECSGNEASTTLTAKHQSDVHFTNTRTTDIDTGVRLDGVPYAMTFGTATVGFILLFVITRWKAVIK